MKSWKARLALVLIMVGMLLAASLPAMAATTNSSKADLRAIRQIAKECKAAGFKEGTPDFQDCVSAGGPFSDNSPDTSDDNADDSGTD